jgi:type II secretory pathway pseudopilin PulG
VPRHSAANFMEIAVVAVMLTLVGFIAIPRMSRGAAASHETALLNSLRKLREALERYALHHGEYPHAEHVMTALTLYSDLSGTVFSAVPDPSAGVVFGPYLRSIPPLPVPCARRGDRGIAQADAEGVGWIYVVNPAGIGQIHANTAAEADAMGLPYAAY